MLMMYRNRVLCVCFPHVNARPHLLYRLLAQHHQQAHHIPSPTHTLETQIQIALRLLSPDQRAPAPPVQAARPSPSKVPLGVAVDEATRRAEIEKLQEKRRQEMEKKVATQVRRTNACGQARVRTISLGGFSISNSFARHRNLATCRVSRATCHVSRMKSRDTSQES